MIYKSVTLEEDQLGSRSMPAGSAEPLQQNIPF